MKLPDINITILQAIRGLPAADIYKQQMPLGHSGSFSIDRPKKAIELAWEGLSYDESNARQVKLCMYS